MTPCGKNRKAIAWLAVGALDARQARELRAHFETCAHCRGYWNEMSRVTEKLAAAEENPQVEAGGAFRQKLAGKLRAAESPLAGNAFSAYLVRMFPGWRIAIPVGAAVALTALGITVAQRYPAVSPGLPMAVIKVESPRLGAEISPTMGNYEMAASESLDKLDELLTRQGGRVTASTPVYTAAMLGTPGATD